MSEIGEASGAGGVALSAAGALSRLHAERLAKNVPLSASELYNPALTPSSVLGRFLESWPSIFVLCYKETCDAHRHSGAADGRRVWWQSIQPRVVVFDGAEVDARHTDAVRWAGCDLPDAPAGRSGAPPTREPCTFAQPSGGADWRRTSKHRLLATLGDLSAAGAGGRSCLCARELTKRHEELRRGSVDAVKAWFEEVVQREGRVRGEVTLVLAPLGAEALQAREDARQRSLAEQAASMCT